MKHILLTIVLCIWLPALKAVGAPTQSLYFTGPSFQAEFYKLEQALGSGASSLSTVGKYLDLAFVRTIECQLPEGSHHFDSVVFKYAPQTTIPVGVNKTIHLDQEAPRAVIDRLSTLFAGEYIVVVADPGLQGKIRRGSSFELVASSGSSSDEPAYLVSKIRFDASSMWMQIEDYREGRLMRENYKLKCEEI